MAKPGEVKVKTTYTDALAASHWLVRHARDIPKCTVLTGLPNMEAWRKRRFMLSALASDLAIRSNRRHSSDGFTLVMPRGLLVEFQLAYAPTRFVAMRFPTGSTTGVDRFASAVDRALGGRVGRPPLSRSDRMRRLVDPAPCFAVGERQQKRLRQQDRIEAQRLEESLSRKGTVLTGGGVANFS